MGRWGKLIVLSALLVIVGSVGLPVVYLVRYASKSGCVEAEIARIRSEGLPASADELAGKPVPDSRNGAIQYEEAVKPLDTPTGRQDLYRIREFLRLDVQQRSPEMWAELRAVTVHRAGSLELARKASAMPECRFPAEPRDSRAGYGGRQFSFMRSLPRLAWAQAVIDAKDGRPDRALQSVELILRMGESMKNDRSSAGVGSRYRAVALATDALIDVGRLGRVREPEARSLADYIAGIDLSDSATRALQAERATTITLFEQMRKGGVRSSYSGSYSDSGSLADKLHGVVPVGWALNNDEANYLRDIRLQIELVGDTYRSIRTAGNSEVSPPAYSLYAPWNAAMGARAALARDQAIARLDGDRVFLGLLAYHSRFGSYPATLEELVSKLKWRTAADPFSGKPFVYRRQGRGFVLYSIGANLKDDNGTPWQGDRPGNSASARGGIARDFDEAGDYVWKL